MGGVNCEPCMPRFEAVGRFACPMGRARMSAKRAKTVRNRQEPSEDLLQILVLYFARVNAEMLAHHAPNRLQILLGRCRQLLVRNYYFANGFKNITCGRYCLTRRVCDVLNSALKFLIDGVQVRITNEFGESARWRTHSTNNLTAPNVLQFSFGQRC